ncbi:hypothetical protein ACOL23_11715 [Aliarcobacter butzleri]|jgi:hypothetical protein|uniref:hypothetical protein n=1 Tax=Aliarcobacter TaxID=2321111 RepID=UPI0021B4E01C|nr:hypothetical protein [Aliarcobacter cryaerophilus]MCT7535928.1 hypothetical protein [Aliarcobacter cryaerophilus]
MKFVQKEFTATLDEKKSKFLAFLVPYKDFDKTMQRLRSEHPKAVHFVYAYRYLNEFELVFTILFIEFIIDIFSSFLNFIFLLILMKLYQKVPIYGT